MTSQPWMVHRNVTSMATSSRISRWLVSCANRPRDNALKKQLSSPMTHNGIYSDRRTGWNSRDTPILSHNWLQRGLLFQEQSSDPRLHDRSTIAAEVISSKFNVRLACLFTAVILTALPLSTGSRDMKRDRISPCSQYLTNTISFSMTAESVDPSHVMDTNLALLLASLNFFSSAWAIMSTNSLQLLSRRYILLIFRPFSSNFAIQTKSVYGRPFSTIAWALRMRLPTFVLTSLLNIVRVISLFVLVHQHKTKTLAQ